MCAVPPARLSERLSNILRAIPFALFSGRHVTALKRLITAIDLAPGLDARATYAIIDRELPKLSEAFYRHVGALMGGIVVEELLPEILTKLGQPTEQLNAEVIRLITGAGGIESYDLAAGIFGIVSALVMHDEPQLDHLLALERARCGPLSPARGEF